MAKDKSKPLLIFASTGNRRTISTSKIKKIIASKKNRKEKGNRADLIGSKPHSKGEFFSRSLTVRLANIQPKIITIEDKRTAKKLLKTVLDI
jgi:hypothetical protein